MAFYAPIFLIKNKKIFKNKIVYVLWQWSFGHQILGYDWASRLYWPNRISMIEIKHSRCNSYLHKCFEHNIDHYFCGNLFFPKNRFFSKINHNFGKITYYVIRFYTLLASFILNFDLISSRNIYKTLSFCDNSIPINDLSYSKKITNYDPSGYFRLIRSKIGVSPQLSPFLYSECKNVIQKHFPSFFDKPLAILSLRMKGSKSQDFINKSRNPSSHRAYFDAVNFLSSIGYNVVGIGETEHNFFESINGYYPDSIFSYNRSILQLFFLTSCNMYIGQHSGPLYLPASNNIPLFLSDVFPFWQGSPGKNDLLLYKNVSKIDDEENLSVVNIAMNHNHLYYSFDTNFYVLRDNTPEDILLALKEFIEPNLGIHSSKKYKMNLFEYWKSIPNDVLAHHFKNNIPSFVFKD